MFQSGTHLLAVPVTRKKYIQSLANNMTLVFEKNTLLLLVLVNDHVALKQINTNQSNYIFTLEFWVFAEVIKR